MSVAEETLRKRPKINALNNETSEKETESTEPPPSRRTRSVKQFLYEEWDTLSWIGGSLAVTYYTDFWMVVFYGELVNRFLLHCAVGLFLVGMVAMAILFWRHPKLHYTNWLQEAPIGISIATVLFLLGILSITFSLWPIWGIFTPSILFIIFMSFISILSLL